MELNIYEISLFGMSYEKLRLTAASTNIANANAIASSPNNLKYSSIGEKGSSQFAQLLASGNATQYELVEEAGRTKAVFKPDHSAADENGFIYSLDVNVAEQMLAINSATRAYEANVKAFNAFRSMNAKAMEIGK